VTQAPKNPLFEVSFVILIKQKVTLDKWEKKDPNKIVVEDAGDVTTEEEGPDFYDSDYSI
jgi:hypothetical protein